MNKDFSNIRLVRIFDALLVPRYLLEQVKGLPFEIDDFYRFFSFYSQSPLSFLYIIMDAEDLQQPQKGCLWMSADPIPQCLTVHLLSLHKDYQHKRLIQEKIHPFLINAKNEMKLKKGYWATTRPKAWVKMFEHAKLSELQIIEFDDREGE